MDKIDDMVNIFKALGDATRFNILKTIAASGNNLCVTAISERLNVSQPMISQHLKILKNAGVVKAEKLGYHVHYSVDMNTLENVSKLLNEITVKSAEKCEKPECIDKRS